MFKRTSSVAMLIVLILSYSVGSAGYATAYQAPVTTTTGMTSTSVIVKDNVYHLYPPGTTAPPSTAMALGAERLSAVSPEEEYTTVVVNMGSIHYEPQFPRQGELMQGQMFTRSDAMILTGNYVTIRDRPGVLIGNVMMYEPGNMTPREVPVRWEANGSRDHGKPEFFAHVMIAAGGIEPANMSGVYEFRSKIVLDEAVLADRTFVISHDASQYNQAVKAGDDNWHTVNVGEAIDSMDVDLKWEEGDSDLRLMIYTPDGKVLGPYYDDADGTTDGRINLNISNTGGLAAGEWYLKVSDTALVGETDYYVRTS